jgi:hypothetical protein
MVTYLVAATIDLDQLTAAIEAYHRASMSGDGRQGGRHDQVDRYCLLCLWRRSLGASDDSRPDSSAGCRHHTSRRGLRPGQDDGERCVRGQNHHPPRAPRGPQVCAMECRRLRRVALKARRRVHRKSDANFSSRQSQPCFRRDEGQQCVRVEPRSQAERVRTGLPQRRHYAAAGQRAYPLRDACGAARPDARDAGEKSGRDRARRRRPPARSLSDRLRRPATGSRGAMSGDTPQ